MATPQSLEKLGCLEQNSWETSALGLDFLFRIFLCSHSIGLAVFLLALTPYHVELVSIAMCYING